MRRPSVGRIGLLRLAILGVVGHVFAQSGFVVAQVRLGIQFAETLRFFGTEGLVLGEQFGLAVE